MPETKRISSVREISRRGDRVQPIVLERAMRDYLTQFRQALADGVFCAHTELYGKACDKREPHLINAARAFDEYTQDGIGDPQVVVCDEMTPVLEEINEGTRLNSRCPSFSETVTNYYQTLGWGVNQVVRRVQTGGMDYLMDGVQGCREEAVADIEGLLMQFRKAREEVNNEALCVQSPRYKSIEDDRQMLEFASTNRDLIIGKLNHVVGMMGDPAGDNRERAHQLLLVTNDLMHHLADNLADSGLTVLQKNGKQGRPLTSLPNGPLHQLEAVLSILNPVVRDHEECVTPHRDLLLGKEEYMGGEVSQKTA